MNKLKERVCTTEGGRRLAAIFGPIIGALPGIIILVAVSSLGKISTVSSLVIIYGAIEGYRWSGKQPKLPACLYIFLINIGMIFLGEWMSVWVEGIVVFCQEYGLGVFWDSVLYVPAIIAESPEIQSDIVVNAVLGIVMSIPAGIYLFWAAHRNQKGQPFQFGPSIAASSVAQSQSNPCKTGRDGNPCLVMAPFFKGLFGFCFVCGVLLAGVLVIFPDS